MPSRRLTALAAVLLSAAPAARAQSRAATVPLPPPPAGTTLVRAERPARPGFEVAALLGGAKPQGGGDVQPLLRLDASFPVTTTQAGLDVYAVLPTRLVYLVPLNVPGGDVSGVEIEVTPSARVVLPLRAGQVSLRCDAGVGVGFAWTRTKTDLTFLGEQTRADQTTRYLLRVGLGLEFALPRGTRLTLEPLSLGYDLDGGADWSFLAGASFRL